MFNYPAINFIMIILSTGIKF